MRSSCMYNNKESGINLIKVQRNLELSASAIKKALGVTVNQNKEKFGSSCKYNKQARKQS